MRSDAPASVPGIALLVLLAVLVALAGCTSGPEGTTTTTPGVTETPVAETTSAGTPGTTTAPARTTTAPARTTTAVTGTPENTVTPVDIASDHTATLNAAGSFTTLVFVEESVARGDQWLNATVERTIYADLEARRGLSTRRVSEPSEDPLRTVTFTDGNETYQRVGTSGAEPRYSYDAAPYDGSIQPVNEVVTRGRSLVTAPIEWTPAGTGVVAGTPARRYTANGTGAFGFDLIGFVDRPLQRVRSASATAYVDGDGVVRLVRLQLTAVDTDGNTYRRTQRYAVTDVGSTSVSDPVWLSDAKAATAGGA